MRRPIIRPNIGTTGHGTLTTTPRVEELILLLGGHFRSGAITFSRDEFRAIKKLYRFTEEQPNEKPPAPDAPKKEDYTSNWEFDLALDKHKRDMERWHNWQDPRPLMQAGADQNAIRHASADGLRMLAWIAKYLQPGTDPVVALVQLAVNAGWDVDYVDSEWADTTHAEDELLEE